MAAEVTLFGYQISCRGLEGDVAAAKEFIMAQQGCHYLACANPHSLVVASRDDEFAAALKGAALLVPDGHGIILAAKALGLPLRQRVPGYDFFLALTAALSRANGARYFFLGSTTHVLEQITARLQREFPAIDVVGTLSPPFQPSFSQQDNQDMVAAVNAAQPDVLWVGMTAPKQEKWIWQNRPDLQVPFVGAIGAAFDFFAGAKQRAGLAWQKLGLEWLPRFMREPQRLWERNLKSTPIFLYWILKARVRQKPALPQ